MEHLVLFSSILLPLESIVGEGDISRRATHSDILMESREDGVDTNADEAASSQVQLNDRELFSSYGTTSLDIVGCFGHSGQSVVDSLDPAHLG